MNALTLGILVAAIVAVAVIVALLFSTVPQRRPAARGALDAFHLLLLGRREEARALLTQLVKDGKAPAESYLELGRLLREDGQAQRALALHQGILARPGLSPELRRLSELALAEDLLALNRAGEAAQRLGELDNRVVDEAILGLRARALHRLKRPEEAASVLERRIKLAKTGAADAARYFAEIAREALANGQLDGARQRARRARKHDPTLAAGYVVEGDVAIAEGKEDEAARIWKDGIGNCPSGRVPLLARRVEQAFRLGQLDRTLEELENLRAEEPEDPALWRAVADLRLRRGDLESFYLLIEDPPVTAELDLASAAGWLRHIMRQGDEQQIQRLLRCLPDAFGARSWRCRHCGHEEPEARDACMSCGRLVALQPVRPSRPHSARAALSTTTRVSDA